jgi:hypothetical protein
MHLCNKHLSPLQRRSMQIFGANLALIVFLTTLARDISKHDHPGMVLVYLFAIFPAIPVAFIVAAAGRYLARETDEFIRMLVMQSLLWGLGVTMVADTLLGGLFLGNILGGKWPDILPLFNIDLFSVTAMAALRIQLWRNQ